MVTVAAVAAVAAVVALPTVNDTAVPVNPVPGPENAAAVMLPLADTMPVMLTPAVVNTATLPAPATEMLALPLAAVVTFVVPLIKATGADATTPVNKLPLPMKNVLLVIFPVADNTATLATAAFGTSLQIVLEPS